MQRNALLYLPGGETIRLLFKGMPLAVIESLGLPLSQKPDQFLPDVLDIRLIDQVVQLCRIIDTPLLWPKTDAM